MRPTGLRRISFLSLLMLASCTTREDPALDPGGDVATMVLALMNAPADVFCLRVVVTGSQVVTRTFPVMPGESATLQLGGLPLGPATVYAEAFGVGCASVGPNTQATWVAQA